MRTDFDPVTWDAILEAFEKATIRGVVMSIGVRDDDSLAVYSQDDDEENPDQCLYVAPDGTVVQVVTFLCTEETATFPLFRLIPQEGETGWKSL